MRTSRWWIAGLALIGLVLIAIDPHFAGIAGAVLILVFAAAFVAVYRKSRWRQTDPGRAVMGMVGVCVILAVWMLWINISGIYPGSESLRAAMYFAAVLVLANLLRSLLGSGNARRRRRPRDSSSET